MKCEKAKGQDGAQKDTDDSKARVFGIAQSKNYPTECAGDKAESHDERNPVKCGRVLGFGVHAW